MPQVPKSMDDLTMARVTQALELDPRLHQPGAVPPPSPPPYTPPEYNFNILGLYPGLESLNMKPKPTTSYGTIEYQPLFGSLWWWWVALWCILDAVMTVVLFRVLWGG